MCIIQNFYDSLATQYDKLFLNWQETTDQQALLLDRLFRDNGFDPTAKVLDCACGIGTQAIGLAALGYPVTASDISKEELKEAKKRAEQKGICISFACADFRALQQVFSQPFDIIIAMDNALPHMLSRQELSCALESIINQLAPGGIFVASIRDYDKLLEAKPPYAPPYIHKTAGGQRICFQTWDWDGDIYTLTQYILEDEKTLQASKFRCQYRATRREEMADLLMVHGCSKVMWLMPEETGFYQPIVIAKK